MQIHLTGVVERYSGNGRKLGYPTANIAVAQETPEGVFVGTVTLNGTEMPAIIFVGIPVVFDEVIKRAEAHILDFEDRDLYGSEIEFTIMEKLRDNEKFDSIEELITAMDLDKQAAQEYFREHPANVAEQ